MARFKFAISVVGFLAVLGGLAYAVHHYRLFSPVVFVERESVGGMFDSHTTTHIRCRGGRTLFANAAIYESPDRKFVAIVRDGWRDNTSGLVLIDMSRCEVDSYFALGERDMIDVVWRADSRRLLVAGRDHRPAHLLDVPDRVLTQITSNAVRIGSLGSNITTWSERGSLLWNRCALYSDKPAVCRFSVWSEDEGVMSTPPLSPPSASSNNVQVEWSADARRLAIRWCGTDLAHSNECTAATGVEWTRDASLEARVNVPRSSL